MFREIDTNAHYKIKGDLLKAIDRLCKCMEQPYQVSNELPYCLGKLSAMYEKSYIEEITRDK